MIVETKRFVASEQRWVSNYFGLSTDEKPTGHINGSKYHEIDTGDKYMYDEDNNLWVKQPSGGGGGGDVESMFVHADSHTTKESYVVPVLTDEQIVAIYNGIVAGNNVFIVDDLDTITIQVLDASSIDPDVSVVALFRDKLVLKYQVGEEVVATPIGGGTVQKATSISDNPSDDKLPTEKAIYNYLASGNSGKPRALDSVDLDNVLATGFYSCNVCTHRPTENNGVMLVIKNAAASDHAIQVYWTFIADKIWVRHRDHGTWKAWNELATTSYVNTNAITIVKLEDGTITLADIVDILSEINSAGKHVFFDTSSLSAQMYLCTIYVDDYDDPDTFRVQDQVTGKLNVGTYDASLTLQDILDGAVEDFASLIITANTLDGVDVTGQTVTIRKGQTASSPIHKTIPYEGQPVSITLPIGFEYFVEISSTIPAHFNPTTAQGVISQTTSVVLTYSDTSHILTYNDIKAAIAQGLRYNELKTVVINDTWTDENGHVWDDPAGVRNILQCEGEDGELHWTAIMQRVYASYNAVQYDAPEGAECNSAIEMYAGEGLYYYGQTGASKTASALTLLSLNTGDLIPYGDYDKIYKCSIRDTSKNILQYGYNRYRDSAWRQMLLSDAGVGEWFEATHVGDNPPSQAATTRGYKAGCSPEMLAAIKPIKISCYTNSVTDGSVIDTMYDDIFLPSGTEMYGSVNANEGVFFPYWKDATGLDAPSNSANDGRKIYSISNHSQAKYCWLRSAHHSNSYNVCYVTDSGKLHYDYAYNSIACAPAFAIY